MKKRIFAIAIVVLCLSVLASTTIAYFLDTETARNVITTGGIDVKIVEQQSDNGTFRPYPDQPIPVMPSTTVSKIVSVENVKQPAWIRARYTVTVYDADDKQVIIPAEELTAAIRIQPDSDAWTQKDGWWYYNTAVDTGRRTTPLFEQVVFSGPDMDNRYRSCTVKIDITAQALQQANNGPTVMDATGWPED